MNNHLAYVRECVRGYQRISKLTGIALEDMFGRCLAVVKDEKSEYFGQVGVIEWFDTRLDNHSFGVNFGGRKNVTLSYDIKSSEGMDQLDQTFYYGLNVPLIIEQLNQVKERKNILDKKRKEEETRRKVEAYRAARYPLLRNVED